ncbi:Phenylalanine-trna ligase, partial [Globisporangium splendens]
MSILPHKTVQEQPHEIGFRAVGHAEDWKRKFQKEIKWLCNGAKIAGSHVSLAFRMLSCQELKQRLHDEKVRYQHVVTQFRDYKVQHECETCVQVGVFLFNFTACQLAVTLRECARYLLLREEIDELKKRLGFQEQLQPNQESEDSVELEATVVQHDDFDDEALDLPTSSSADSTDNTAASIVSPLSIKQNEPQGDENVKPIEPPQAQDGTPKTKQADPIRFPSSFREPTSRSHHPIQERQQEPANRSAAHGNHSTLTPALYQSTSFNSFIGYDDSSSLGELFKYAVVLAGPMDTKPPRISLAKRKSIGPYCRQHHHNTVESAVYPIKIEAAGKTDSIDKPIFLTNTSGIHLGRAADAIAATEARMARQLCLTEIPWHRHHGDDTATSSSYSGSSRSPDIHRRRARTRCTLSSSRCCTCSASVENGVCVFPPQTKDVAELEGLVELCFPYGERGSQASESTLAALKRTLQERHRTYRNADSTFVLTIASASNPCEITCAICVICPLFADDPSLTSCDPQQQHDAGSTPETETSSQGGQQTTQCCLCLLSPYPSFGLFFKVLFGVAVLWEEKRKAHNAAYALALKDKQSPLPALLTLSDFAAHFQTILSQLQQMWIPSMGGWSRMVLSPDITHLSFHRPHSESVAMKRRMLLLEYAASTHFALLSVDQVLFLLRCLCCEQKVLVVSDHVNIVSSCVLALITLLSPLQWGGPIITVLPPRLDELLEAPVPLIAGQVSINSVSIPEFSTLAKPMKGVIEMNMDQDNLCMHSDDLMNYHELKLPGCDALVHELAYFASHLFAKHNDPEFPTVQQAEACEVICTRIRRHFEFLCSLALGETSEMGNVEQRRYRGLLPVFFVIDGYFAQRQEQQAKDAAAAAVEDDDDDDDDDDMEENDTANGDQTAAACDPDTLFTYDAIIYEPDALCCLKE